jgi:FkbM family methyltransferase
MLITHYDYSKLNIKTVVHVGANIGEELEFYTNIGVNKIYFFEPRQEAMTELIENCKKYKNNVDIIIYPFGLGSTKEEKTIYNGGQSSSFLPPKLHLDVHPQIYFNKGKTLSIRRGDTILPDNLYIDMLNIDVQGYELEVLKGLGNLLNNTNLIYTEINVDELYENCPTIDYIDSYLYSFKFKRVEAIVTDAKWGDAIYIKQ